MHCNQYSWHKPIWQRLQQQINQQRLPQALLLTGQAGLGKNAFAQQLAEYLLCQDDASANALWQAQTHPDFMLLTPEKSGAAIKVDQIRQLNQSLTQTAHRAKQRVVIITPAEQLNIAASNALLKTLEEPNSQCVFLLVTEQPNQLLATIRSRCQTCYFPPQSATTVQAFLQPHTDDVQKIHLVTQLAAGSPLLALDLLQGDLLEQRSACYQQIIDLQQGQADPLLVAEKMLDFEAQQVNHWLQTWLSDGLRCLLGADHELINNDYRASIEQICANSSIESWLELLNKTQWMTQQMRQQPNLNRQLQYERYFLAWT